MLERIKKMGEPAEDLLRGTWKCHVCKELRPDEKISVRSVPIIVDGQACGVHNTRYCNDRQSCIDKAHNNERLP